MSDVIAVLRQPRWLVLAVFIAAVVPLCVSLGFWQLDRLDERAALNEIWTYRIESAPTDVTTVLAAASALEEEDLRYLNVTAGGEFVADQQILIRGRSRRGSSGHWVVAPMRLDATGATVAVLRGWVPLGADDPADPLLAPPSGTLDIGGWLVPGEHPLALGPQDPAEGDLDRMSNLDLDRLGAQLGVDLGPAYLQLATMTADDDGLVKLIEPPVADDPGPHLTYAIQWFAFALIAAAGFVALIRRETRLLARRRESGEARETADSSKAI